MLHLEKFVSIKATQIETCSLENHYCPCRVQVSRTMALSFNDSQSLSLNHPDPRTDGKLELVAKRKYSAMHSTKEKGLCCTAKIKLPIFRINVTEKKNYFTNL